MTEGEKLTHRLTNKDLAAYIANGGGNQPHGGRWLKVFDRAMEVIEQLRPQKTAKTPQELSIPDLVPMCRLFRINVKNGNPIHLTDWNEDLEFEGDIYVPFAFEAVEFLQHSVELRMYAPMPGIDNVSSLTVTFCVRPKNNSVGDDVHAWTFDICPMRSVGRRLVFVIEHSPEAPPSFVNKGVKVSLKP